MKAVKSAAMLSMALLFTLSACKSPTGEVTPSSDPAPQELTFTRKNFPRLDGSADAVPLAQNLAAVLLGEFQQQTSDLTKFNGAESALRRLRMGKNDLILLSDPPQAMLDQLEQDGFEVQMEELATDGLVFVVHADNPVDSLTVEQLRDIYTGDITNWKEVGGKDAEILPFQHTDDTGSQALMDRLVMDGETRIEPLEGYSMVGVWEFAGIPYTYDNSPNAIGYTFYRHTQDLEGDPNLKLLQVEGVVPSTQTVSDHTYPLTTTYYVAMGAQQDPNSPTAALFSWLLSPTGRQLLEGYPSTAQGSDTALTTTVTAHWDRLEPIHTPKSQRWYEEYTDHLIPSKEYGPLIPYIGGSLATTPEPLWIYGLATQDGVMVTDPVFYEVSYLEDTDTPMLVLTTYETDANGNAQQRLGLAAADGSWYSGQDYTRLLGVWQQGVIMVTPEETLEIVAPDGTATPFHTSRKVDLPALPSSVIWPCLHWPTDDTMLNYLYIDLRDGTVSTQTPADFHPSTYTEGKGTFADGWFQLEGTTLTIHTTADATHTLDVGENCSRADVNGDRVLLVYDTDHTSFRVTDWEGNTIFSGEGYAPAFLTPTHSDTPALLSYHTVSSGVPTSYVVMSRDGKSPFAAQGFVHQHGNRLIYVTQSHYILSNLAGDPLLCLPRLGG